MPRFADCVTGSERRAHYLATGLWDESTLAGQAARHALTARDSTAVIDSQGRVTFGDLVAQSAALAVGLRERGVGRGSVVSVQLPNQYEAVVAAVAIQSIGAVINPLLPNYRIRELSNVFRGARPAAIITPAEYRQFDYRALVDEVGKRSEVCPLHIVVGGSPGRSGVAWDALTSDGAGDRLAPGDAADVSELIFTSGTEARPKAIMHTEQTANFSVRVAHSDLGLDTGDVVWMPSPVGHSTGFNYGLRMAAYYGLPLVLQDRWDGLGAAQLIERERCSYTLAATTFLQDLIAAAGVADMSSLQFFGCGGAPVPPALVDGAASAGIRVLRLYGSTEVLVATWNRPDSPTEALRMTDGRPMSHVEVEVRPEDNQPVAEGEPGEGYVRGPNTCVGFYDDPERTAATFDSDGWLRSGDIVAVDGSGYLTVVGRKKEIIIRGGLNITPREIEEMLASFPEVSRAVVVGLPAIASANECVLVLFSSLTHLSN